MKPIFCVTNILKGYGLRDGLTVPLPLLADFTCNCNLYAKKFRLRLLLFFYYLVI